MARKFASASDFKTALEARLRRKADEQGVPFSTLQLKFVIERLLARLFRDPSPPWLLKGGFAMDLRFRPQARTTKDVDLSVALLPGAAGPLVESLVRRVCGEAIQVHGGIGFTWEYDLHIYFKRAKSLEVMFGDAEFHRELIARHVTA